MNKEKKNKELIKLLKTINIVIFIPMTSYFFYMIFSNLSPFFKNNFLQINIIEPLLEIFGSIVIIMTIIYMFLFIPIIILAIFCFYDDLKEIKENNLKYTEIFKRFSLYPILIFVIPFLFISFIEYLLLIIFFI